MTLSPAALEPVPPLISRWTWGWGNVSEGTEASSGSSGVWTYANQGRYVSIFIPTITLAKRMWWVNGATVDAGYNVEAGIYLDGGHKPGAKLVTTGSVAQGTATQVQFADITDTPLRPGLYWLFLSCSSADATFMTSVPSSNLVSVSLAGFLQSSIGPGSSPATATPAEMNTNTIRWVGIDTRGVG